MNLAEKVLLKDDEHWEQSSFSLSSFTTERGLLHSLMELYAGTPLVHGRYVPYHPILREQTPSLDTEERTHQGKCGKGMSPPHRAAMFSAKLSLSYPIRFYIKNQKLPNRLSLQNRAIQDKLTNWRAMSSGSHFKLANERWRYAGQGLNDITLLRQSKMKRGS